MASKFLRELELISGTAKDGWEVRLDLLEQMQNLIILVQNHQIVFINPAGLRWLGYEKSVLLESEIGGLFHPDYARSCRSGPRIAC